MVPPWFLSFSCPFLPSIAHTNTNKRAGWNRRAGGNFFSKSINVQTKIRPCRREFFLKVNKRACTFIRYTRVFWKIDDFTNTFWLYLTFTTFTSEFKNFVNINSIHLLFFTLDSYLYITAKKASRSSSNPVYMKQGYDRFKITP